jgi:hypothetical protein
VRVEQLRQSRSVRKLGTRDEPGAAVLLSPSVSVSIAACPAVAIKVLGKQVVLKSKHMTNQPAFAPRKRKRREKHSKNRPDALLLLEGDSANSAKLNI